MPRTIELIAYKFEELSKKAQQKAIDDHLDINVDYQWWEMLYEDAQAVDIVIEEADWGYGTIKTSLQSDVYTTCQKIMKHYGKKSDLYKLAKEYTPQFMVARLKGWDPKTEDLWCYLFPEDTDDYDYQQEEQYEEWTAEFKKRAERILIKWLQDEYEWRLSKEQIAETLEANEYEFDEKGDRI